ncbi:MAG: hypothetical protein KIS66_06220 [Fimbriimonadaceae bacterium]|nr:hypothetical protein [Fimbriimonadaceae bacterium]
MARSIPILSVLKWAWNALLKPYLLRHNTVIALLFGDSEFADCFNDVRKSLVSYARRLIGRNEYGIDADDIVSKALLEPIRPDYAVSDRAHLTNLLKRVVRRNVVQEKEEAKAGRYFIEHAGEDLRRSQLHVAPPHYEVPQVATLNGSFFKALRSMPAESFGTTYRTIFVLENALDLDREEAYHRVDEAGWPQVLPKSMNCSGKGTDLRSFKQECLAEVALAAAAEIQPSEQRRTKSLRQLIARDRKAFVTHVYPAICRELGVQAEVAADPVEKAVLTLELAILLEEFEAARYYLSSETMRNHMRRGNEFLGSRLRNPRSIAEVAMFREACYRYGIEPCIHNVFEDADSAAMFLQTYCSGLDSVSPRL